MKIKNIKRHPYKITTILLIVLVILLFVVLIGYGNKIRQLDNEINGVGSDTQKQETSLASFPVKVYIQNALNGLYRDAPVASATESRAYFPEMKIYLPLSDQARALRYFYAPADSSAHLPAEAEFSNIFFINRLMRSFNDVPCMQRLVSVGVNGKLDTDLTTAGDVKLQDGRVLYLYKNTEKACQNFYDDNGPEQIINLLKQSKSY